MSGLKPSSARTLTSSTSHPLGGLRGRLAFSHLFVASAALLVVAIWLPRVVQQHEIARLEQRLADEARLARRIIEPELDGARSAAPSPRSPLQRLVRQVGEEVEARVTVIDLAGRVYADSLHDPATMENHANRPEIRQALRLGLGESLRYSRTLGMDRLYVAVPVWKGQSGPRALGDGVSHDSTPGEPGRQAAGGRPAVALAR